MVEAVHSAPPLEWDTPLYRQARTQFEQALPFAGISEHVAERLRYPERAVILSLPVRLDDGTVRSFPAYRVQHSSVLGPTKGGIRYDDAVNLGECAALAMWMTWKCALLRSTGHRGGFRAVSGSGDRARVGGGFGWSSRVCALCGQVAGSARMRLSASR